MAFRCPHCSKPYAKKNAWYEDHIKKCKKNPQISETKHTITRKKRRKSIDPNLRKLMWDTYIGQHTSAKCFCCWQATITPFTYCNTVQAGHIKSHAHGGADTITNLLPICRDCNMNMKEEDWDDYIKRHPHLSLRTYGANPSEKVIWSTTVIQSLVRMYLERKNPHSVWRLEWGKRNTIIVD